MFLVDAAVANGYDISFIDECTVHYNERFSNDTSLINRLMLDFNDFEGDDDRRRLAFETDFTAEYSMESAATEYVDHFSATKIELFPESTSYYPGFTEMFDYLVTDRLGNIIVNATAESTSIQLTSGPFTSLLHIDDDGFCQNCLDGVTLSEISIASNVGDNYTLQLTADNNMLILEPNEITFDITGCPIGVSTCST